MASQTQLFSRLAYPIITAANLPYTANSVFNPAATTLDGTTILLLRVEDRRGISHLTVARSPDGIGEWQIDAAPTLLPDPERHPEEVWGIEDPRITWLPEKEVYAIAYTAFSHSGPLVSLALTTDFRSFERLGPAMPPEDKDAALFPCRIQGRWALIHRPTPVRGGANMWLSFSPDLRHWGDHTLLLPARDGGWWDSARIGLGPPPLETDEGWLVMYHGARLTAAGAIYRLGLALLDREDPRVVLHRSEDWVFGPSEVYERQGDVADVVFPCGWVRDPSSGRLHLYYGAADTCVALAVADLADVLAYVRRCPRPDEGGPSAIARTW